MEIIISVIGAISAVIVAVIGAFITYQHNNDVQIYKLKEEHYILYMEALHNLATNNENEEYIKKYTYYRNKLLIVGSESVIKAILKFEKEAVGKKSNLHDEYLTTLLKEIRKDLKIKDKEYPNIHLKK